MKNTHFQQSDRSLIVLASSSPRRQELITSLGLPHVVQPSDADETVPADWAPTRIVEALALRKAQAVAQERHVSGEDGIVIGSDTIVVLDGEVLGKPHDEADAERMLTSLQGRSHEVYTGVALVRAADGRQEVSHRVTTVHMTAWTQEQIRRYIATGEPMDKAGSYAIQGIGATLVTGIEGCYFNVVGLPLSLLTDMLKMFDIIIP
ncbi:Maf family protein [Paenibacillus profundus]|uniref:Maf family protein n=1 Tax=Paenibacillus profundus TaxID=1173085 RepID=UPI001F199C03|nr:Maf family protein [Paenibacillus profundus]